MSRYANVERVQGLEQTSQDIVEQVVSVILGPVGSSVLNATSRALRQSTARVVAQIKRGREEFLKIEQEIERRNLPEFVHHRDFANPEARVFHQLVERAGRGAVYLMLGDERLFPEADENSYADALFPGGVYIRYFDERVQLWLPVMLAWNVDRWHDLSFLRKTRDVCHSGGYNYLRCILCSPGGLMKLMNGTLPHTLYEDNKLPGVLHGVVNFITNPANMESFDFHGRGIPSSLDFLERAKPEWVSSLYDSEDASTIQRVIDAWQAREDSELLDPSVAFASDIEVAESVPEDSMSRWESLHRPVHRAALHRVDSDDDVALPSVGSMYGRSRVTAAAAAVPRRAAAAVDSSVEFADDIEVGHVGSDYPVQSSTSGQRTRLARALKKPER